MGLSVSTTMGFENRNFLRNAAREILQKSGASKEASSKIVDELVFKKNYAKSDMEVISASAQVAFGKSLKETLKYLKNKATKKQIKTPVFGELWKSFNENENEQIQNFELLEFIISEDAENIFAAA